MWVSLQLGACGVLLVWQELCFDLSRFRFVMGTFLLGKEAGGERERVGSVAAAGEHLRLDWQVQFSSLF